MSIYKELKMKLRDHHIPCRIIARELKICESSISKAFSGNNNRVFEMIYALCNDNWIIKNTLPPNKKKFFIQPLCIRALLLAWNEIENLQKSIIYGTYRGSLSSNQYQCLVRLGTDLIVYHYWGLLNGVDDFIDSGLSHMVVDHRFSVDAGYQNNIPFYILCCPFNLRPMSDKENAHKGRKCSVPLQELYNNFHEQNFKFPRLVFAMLRGIHRLTNPDNRIVIPQPTSEYELSLKRLNYFSRNGNKHKYVSTPIIIRCGI